MEIIIREAVGLASPHGRTRVSYNDIKRPFLRLLLWFSFRQWVPYSWREWITFTALSILRRRSIFAGASKGDTYENDLLKLLFNATAIANVADNAASSPLTNLSWALHTADPGESGNQSTNEITYTSYARVSVARTSGGHTVTANSVSPAASVDFPAGTGGSGTATHFSVGPTGGGATKIFYSGTVTPNIVTGNGIQPKLSTATAITED